MADFPAELHEFIDPSTKAGQPLSDGHVAAHVEIAEELAAVQAALGVNLANVVVTISEDYVLTINE